jgi:hypothetical protein
MKIMTMRHSSKKDAWLMLVFALTSALPVALGVFLVITTPPAHLAGWLLIGIGLAVGLLIYWLTHPLHYDITSSKLNVRAGPLRWSIALEDIDEVCPTRNPLGSPALSLDRLLIKYGNGNGPSELMISPQEKKAFLEDLAAAAPELQKAGNALKRPSRREPPRT